MHQKKRNNDIKKEDSSKINIVKVTTEEIEKENPNTLEEDKDEKLSNESDEFEAPDGGWGWMVALGLILVFVRIH